MLIQRAGQQICWLRVDKCLAWHSKPPRFYTTWHTHKKQFMPGNISCLRKLVGDNLSQVLIGPLRRSVCVDPRQASQDIALGNCVISLGYLDGLIGTQNAFCPWLRKARACARVQIRPSFLASIPSNRPIARDIVDHQLAFALGHQLRLGELRSKSGIQFRNDELHPAVHILLQEAPLTPNLHQTSNWT